MAKVVTTVAELRGIIDGWRSIGETVGFVPTMGALHAGHISLVQVALANAKRAIVSIFVNPTQFGPNEDYTKYPRQLDADCKVLERDGCDLIFAPDARKMYPEGFDTKIDPGKLATVLEGAFRPTHFSGVATVVSKLLNQVRPDCAVFGEKDFQQLLIVRQVTRDLDLPVKIIGAPIVRETDGLALSSRNAYLSDLDRQKALVLSATLRMVTTEALAGQNIDKILEEGRERIKQEGLLLDYLEVCNSETLTPVRDLKKSARALVAARVGVTRLIDNMAIDD